MITKQIEKKVIEAFNLLSYYGIMCHVPGCLDINNKDEAVEFAKDKEEFYRKKG